MSFCTAGSSSESLTSYLIGKRVGQGAYAVVRVGIDKKSGDKVAIKVYDKLNLLEP